MGEACLLLLLCKITGKFKTFPPQKIFLLLILYLKQLLISLSLQEVLGKCSGGPE